MSSYFKIIKLYLRSGMGVPGNSDRCDTAILPYIKARARVATHILYEIF